jgi:hypothetical protein
MDGIVPILMLLILLAVLVGTVSIVFIGSMIIFSPHKLGMRSNFFAILSVIIMGLGSALALIGTQSIIGTTPLVYICPLMLLIGIVLMVKCTSIVEHNKALKKDADKNSAS